MHSKPIHNLSKLTAESIADAAQETPCPKNIGRLTSALFGICDFEAAADLNDSYVSNKLLKEVGNEIAVTQLVNAADHLYWKSESNQFTAYIDALNSIASHNDRLKVAFWDFKRKLNDGDIDTLNFSECAHMVLDELN